MQPPVNQNVQPPAPAPTILAGPDLLEAALLNNVKKAARPTFPEFILALFAGAFIGLGGLMYTLVSAGNLGFVETHLLGGLVFCLGLILVLVAGGELLTGNMMLTLPWARRKISTEALLRNLGLVLVGNLIGALLLVAVVYFSGILNQNDGQVAQTAINIAERKSHLSFGHAFFSAILCNFLVCLAVWMAAAGRTLTDKVMAVLFPITAFVALGFEHSVANMYFLPMGMSLDPSRVPLSGALQNLVAVLLGNFVGGGLLVALGYHLAYPTPQAGAEQNKR